MSVRPWTLIVLALSDLFMPRCAPFEEGLSSYCLSSPFSWTLGSALLASRSHLRRTSCIAGLEKKKHPTKNERLLLTIDR
ncbi:hypothetical protein VTK73DRAFT_6486 [Phialemonium thermophilum]|uniref:Secreted protein n=1 Tax=Phialemonium thermophilum TaxID=223376 RepID=A0ABR3V0J9_9PEZI